MVRVIKSVFTDLDPILSLGFRNPEPWGPFRARVEATRSDPRLYSPWSSPAVLAKGAARRPPPIPDRTRPRGRTRGRGSATG